MLVQRIFGRFSTAKDTCLKNLHIKLQGKLVDFAGTLLFI
jgi:hypothetical protein